LEPFPRFSPLERKGLSGQHPGVAKVPKNLAKN
jgi:hypothetical protein